jgi:hypothetical protein
MSISTFLSRFLHSHIPRLAMMLLITLACSNVAFRCQIPDAAKAGDIAKVNLCRR